MTETRTLQFESPRALQSLFANDVKLLKTLEDSLGVKVTTREGWVRLEGEPRTGGKGTAGVSTARRGPPKGGQYSEARVGYALKAGERRTAGNLGDVGRTRITIVAQTAGRGAVAQTSGICGGDPKDTTSSWIGPAGTARLILPSAMAVAALKKEQVARISYLTRPAVEAGEALGFLPAIFGQKSLRISGLFMMPLREMLEAGGDRATHGPAND